MSTTPTGLLLGLLLGMRHALDPDHLAAVSTLWSGPPGRRARGLWLGLCWGLGHTTSLFAVGVLLALLETELPPRLGDAFELLVAVMLVGLGARSIGRALGPARAGEAHATVARRSLAVGLVHGLAGSGALTALVLAGLPSTAARLGYIGVFGAGSVAGMALLSGAAAWPIEWLRARVGLGRGMMLATGALSTVLGLLWGTPLVGRVLGAN
jgi:hypothetical protein